MSKGVKKFIIIAIVVVLVMVAYRFLVVKDPEPDLVGTGAPEVGRELLALLVSLQSISLDGDIFERSDFRSLRDFSVEIPQESLGRRNPFAPIGVGNTGSSLPQEPTEEGAEEDEVETDSEPEAEVDAEAESAL